MPDPRPGDTGQTYWDTFYSAVEPPAGWAPEPNVLLVEELAGRSSGRALDLGCGAGGDAIWLAGSGWRVTAVDVSDVVLRRASAFAADAGVSERIDWRRHDLTRTLPPGEFDLVSAQFLHSPVERPGDRDRVLRAATSAVAPGGSFLVIGHLGHPRPADGAAFDVHLPSNTELLTALDPDPAEWTVVTTRTSTREVREQNGATSTRSDAVLHLIRTS